ncbi:MAG TPA: PilZ domain-containing protein [Bdellovibrionota bacterium]|jgi:hypothetical protein|nr:PilZ domain-containing protein [Bdellovibrionota bacterium]
MSSSSHGKKAVAPQERRRARRADVVRRIRGVYLNCPALGAAEFKVVNVSEYGLGLATSDVIPPPDIGKVFEGVLRVGLTSKTAKLKVVRKTREIIGIEFIDPDEMLRGAIRTFFQPELLGAALKPMKGSTSYHTVLQDPDGNGIDARFEKGDDGDRAIELRIEVLGNEFVWAEGTSLKWMQNGRGIPLDEYTRKQLLRYVANVASMSPAKQALLEVVLRTAPSDVGETEDLTTPTLRVRKDD